MSNKVYDVLKWIAQYFLPAIGTLYFALADTWGLPFAEGDHRNRGGGRHFPWRDPGDQHRAVYEEAGGGSK